MQYYFINMDVAHVENVWPWLTSMVIFEKKIYLDQKVTAGSSFHGHVLIVFMSNLSFFKTEDYITIKQAFQHHYWHIEVWVAINSYSLNLKKC